MTFQLVAGKITSPLVKSFMKGLPNILINIPLEGNVAREVEACIGILIFMGLITVQEISNCLQGDTCMVCVRKAVTHQ
jgi:hypothetical protein